MILRRIAYMFIAVVILFSSCSKSNNFTITGKVTHAEGETLFLEALNVAESVPLGEKQLGGNGEFKFKGETSIPSYFVLKFSDAKFITLLIDSAENIVVEADFANFGKEYKVEGSVGSMHVKDLTDRLNKTQNKLDSISALNELYKNNPDYDQLLPQWQEKFLEIKQEQFEYSTNFVKTNPFSMANVFALYQKYKDQTYVVNDLQTMRVAASALNSFYPQSDQVQALYQNTLAFLKEQRAAEMQKFIQEHGTNSPDIVLPDRDGNEIALSSLRGKVVLLQFWAAEDRGSRIFNPVLVEAYKKYNRKGFEIYQVSIDQNRIEWVDAIDKDKLTWTNVGDMKGSIEATNFYNVRQVPYNYLLDKSGKIVAKDLKGPALDKALARIFN